MPTALALYAGMQNAETKPLHGVGISSMGSTMVIANTDAEAATGAHDPWAIISGTPAIGNAANIRPIAVPKDYTYAEVHHVYENAGATITTKPTVRVYGQVPAAQRFSGKRIWPADVDSTNYADPDTLWIPLVDKDDNVGLQLNHDDGVAAHTGTPIFDITPGIAVFLAGCIRVLVTVEIACVGGVGYNTGMIGLRFTA